MENEIRNILSFTKFGLRKKTMKHGKDGFVKFVEKLLECIDRIKTYDCVYKMRV